MQTVGLIERQIPAGSVFNSLPKERLPGKGFSTSLRLNAMLRGDAVAAPLPYKGKHFRVGGDSFFLVSAIPEAIWNSLPFRSHQVLSYEHARVIPLQRALELLASTFPSGYALCREFVTSIAWVDMSPHERGRDSLITSASTPTLPFCCLVSQKALRHIPPHAFCAEPSLRFLAENLYHEAIHQAVNVNLLLRDIFTTDYDSRNFPKIPIPWRATQAPRNQQWELDRVLHAAVVYANLCDYRLAQLDDLTLRDDERVVFAEALVAGIKVAHYLSKALQKHIEAFDEEGKQLVCDLVKAIAAQGRNLGAADAIWE